MPRCDHCGELVFDYDAEEQINRGHKLTNGPAKNDQDAPASPIIEPVKP